MTPMHPNTYVKEVTEKGAGRMAQWLRSLAAFPEKSGSIPNIHMTS